LTAIGGATGAFTGCDFFAALAVRETALRGAAATSGQVAAESAKARHSANAARYNAPEWRGMAMTEVSDIKANPTRNLVAAAALVVASLVPAVACAQAVDEDAATALAKKGNCFKCHSVDKAKKAPSYARIAQKYKGKADAADVLYKHITGAPVVKLEEGDEKHEPPPTTNDAELQNLIRWILSRG
jgi:cytochrome c